MYLRWIAIVLLAICLTTCPVDAQKRRKGEKKKDMEVVTSAPKPEGGGRRSGRHTTASTTTTTTTLPPTTLAIVGEDIDEEIQNSNEPRSAGNVCPPELKPQDGVVLPCTCRDELDDNALMVECVALSDANQLHQIFNVNFNDS